MEIRQLKYFLAVADQRSFINAASTLFITRQAISKAISQLEQELQVELFMRDSNGAFLTPAGVLFYDRVRGVVAEFDSVYQEMRCYGSRYRQQLCLGFSIGTLSVFEEQLRAFSASQKNADIRYVEYPQHRCQSLLLERKLDAVIVTTPIVQEQLSCDELVSCRMGLVFGAHAPFSRGDLLKLSSLKGYPLAAHADLSLPGGLELAQTGYDYARLFRLADRGSCMLLLPELLAQDLPENLSFCTISDAPKWTLYAVRQRSATAGTLPSSLLDAVLQKLKSEVNANV